MPHAADLYCDTRQRVVVLAEQQPCSSAPCRILRSFGGRRTDAEIRSYEWSGEFDGMAERLVLPFFQAPQHRLPGG
jgi:hypothetical protein